jgi:hypothetical protein
MTSDSGIAGLVVTSHDPGAVNTSTFDHAEFRVPNNFN